MTIWIFVVIAFIAAEPDASKVYGGKTEALCKESLAKAKEALVSTKDMQFGFTECVPMKVPEVPVFKKERDA